MHTIFHILVLVFNSYQVLLLVGYDIRLGAVATRTTSAAPGIKILAHILLLGNNEQHHFAMLMGGSSFPQRRHF